MEFGVIPRTPTVTEPPERIPTKTLLNFFLIYFCALALGIGACGQPIIAVPFVV